MDVSHKRQRSSEDNEDPLVPSPPLLTAILDDLGALLRDENAMEAPPRYFTAPGLTVQVQRRETARQQRVLRIVSMVTSAAFEEDRRVYLFFVGLQQRLAMTDRFETEASILEVQVDACPPRVRGTLETLFGWTQGPVFWQWRVPALLLPRGMGRLHTYLCHGRAMDETAEVDDNADAFHVSLTLDHFLAEPSLVQWSMDGEVEPIQPVVHLPQFLAFFDQVKQQCTLLGNGELATDRGLLVLTLTRVHVEDEILRDFRDPVRLQEMLAYLFAMGRTMSWPLFVTREAYTELSMSRVERPQPLLVPLRGEDYYYWVPQKKPLTALEVETAVVEEEEEDDDLQPLPKHARLYECVQCRQRATFRAAFLPMCSQRCYEEYYA